VWDITHRRLCASKAIAVVRKSPWDSAGVSLELKRQLLDRHIGRFINDYSNVLGNPPSIVPIFRQALFTLPNETLNQMKL
jgi:hypothetical protein